MLNKIIGNKAENLAVHYLEKNGYEIVDSNYSNYVGEIDIIAKKSNHICFIEVKHRLTNKFGLGREAVNISKQRKIRLVAKIWLQKNYSKLDDYRFDVIEISKDEIYHIKDAF